MEQWNVRSWRAKRIEQMPEYPSLEELEKVCETIRGGQGIVSDEEIFALERSLQGVEVGKAFLVQGGECVETFVNVSSIYVQQMVALLRAVEEVIQCFVSCPVVKVGRIGGQFAKPRSSPTELREGVVRPSYHGDLINGFDFTDSSRIPNPYRLLEAYEKGLEIHKFLAEIFHNVSDSNQNFCSQRNRSLDNGFVFSSHECFLLPYEEALVRETEKGFYGSSGHMLWVGERTRKVGSAHLEFVRGLLNPIGVKVSRLFTVEDLMSISELLNPENKSGHLIFIARIGYDAIDKVLPCLLERQKQEGLNITWICDPMHANTKWCGGHKTRYFADILSELKSYFIIHRDCGTYPGGIHLEMTPDAVTECLGGGVSSIETRYESFCDPRLNSQQVLDLIKQVSEFWMEKSSEAGRV